jgi:hypothetical protein
MMVALAGSLAVAASAHGQHAGDLWVGRTSAGQLALDVVCGPSCGFDPALAVIELAPDEFGGWSDDAPGFDRLGADQPLPEDLLTLQSGADIWIRIEAEPPQAEPPLGDLLISPALYIFDQLQFTFFPYEEEGTVFRELRLGDSALHKHFIWFIDAMDPRFGEAGCDYGMTLRLIDKGSTGYAESEPFTLRFEFPHAVADLDCDTDVDGDDFTLFAGCATGPMEPYEAENLPETCLLTPNENGVLPADFDADGDVDGIDFAVYQRCYTGEGMPADVACGS